MISLTGSEIRVTNSEIGRLKEDISAGSWLTAESEFSNDFSILIAQTTNLIEHSLVADECINQGMFILNNVYHLSPTDNYEFLEGEGAYSIDGLTVYKKSSDVLGFYVFVGITSRAIYDFVNGALLDENTTDKITNNISRFICNCAGIKFNLKEGTEAEAYGIVLSSLKELRNIIDFAATGQLTWYNALKALGRAFFSIAGCYRIFENNSDSFWGSHIFPTTTNSFGGSTVNNDYLRGFLTNYDKVINSSQFLNFLSKTDGGYEFTGSSLSGDKVLSPDYTQPIIKLDRISGDISLYERSLFFRIDDNLCLKDKTTVNVIARPSLVGQPLFYIDNDGLYFNIIFPVIEQEA